MGRSSKTTTAWTAARLPLMPHGTHACRFGVQAAFRTGRAVLTIVTSPHPPDKIGVMMLELWSRASDPARGWKAWWCGDNWCGDRQHWPVMINEVVADRRTLVTALPESVDAMFYYSADECDASCRTLAQHEHAQFLAKFGLTAAAFPLLVVDVHNWNAPFGLAPSSSL